MQLHRSYVEMLHSGIIKYDVDPKKTTKQSRAGARAIQDKLVRSCMSLLYLSRLFRDKQLFATHQFIQVQADRPGDAWDESCSV